MDRMMDFFDISLKEHLLGNQETDFSNLDFFAARSAHLAWKMRLRDFLDGKIIMDAHEVASHRDCLLGKWLYGFAKQEYGEMPEMHEMERVHEEMHGLLKEVVAMKNEGRVAEAEEKYESVGPMSEKVIHLLRKVEDQLDL
jgi:methyl-accepting chemotaxis protein